MHNQKKSFIMALEWIIPGLEQKHARHRLHGAAGLETASPSPIEGDVHYHESWELKIPLKGRLHCRFSGCAFDLQPRSALLIAPRTMHFTTRPTDVHRCHAWFNCLCENGDVRLRLMRERQSVYYFLSSDQKAILTLLLGREPDEFCGQIAQVLAHADQSAAQLMTGKWLAIFCTALVQALVSPPSSTPGQELVSRAGALLNNMSGDASLTVGRMAQILDISPKHLSSVFHRLTGVAPRQRLIQIRLERALRLMRSGKFSVKETAGLTGWRNQFYFSNSFHRHYGMTPSQVAKGAKPFSGSRRAVDIKAAP